MSQRFTLDRTSFEQVLCAASLIQQLNRQAARSSEVEREFHPLAEFVQTQDAIQDESLDFAAAMSRVVDLSLKLGRATGAAVWLFEGDRLVCRGVAGIPAADDWLQLEVRSKLEAIKNSNGAPPSIALRPADCNVTRDTIHYPGSIKSLLVAPIHEGKAVAGALSVFSTQFDAFTASDGTKSRLLSGLLTYALGRVAQADLKQSVTVERAAMLQAIDRLIPALTDLAGKQDLGKTPAELFSAIGDLQPLVGRASIPEQLSLPGVEPDSDLADDPTFSRELRILEAPEAVQSPDISPEIIEPSPQIEETITPQIELVTEPEMAEPLIPIDSAPVEPHAQSVPLATRIAQPLEHVAAATSAAILTLSEKFAAAGMLAAAKFRTARSQASPAISAAREKFAAARRYQVRIRIPGGRESMRRVLSMSALPAAIIAVVAVSAIMLALGRNPSRAAESMTAGMSAPPVVQASVSKPEAPKPVEVHPAPPASHRQITDPSLAASLHSLSRYEVAGLRRQALFGDDSAAFLLGMAYETGHYLPQSCAKAAEWVKRAANAGNAPAQHNLGLRYLNGDGVPVDQAASQNWLKKAASHHYARARAILKADR